METVKRISKDLFIFSFSKKEKQNINNTTFTYFHAFTWISTNEVVLVKTRQSVLNLQLEKVI